MSRRAPLAGAEIAEPLPLLGQALQQRCRRPGLAVARVGGGHVGEDLLQPDLVGVEHASATIARETVALEGGDVGGTRTVRYTLPEESRASTHESPEAASDNLV